MAYNNDTEYEAGAPKKADVLIRSTQHIALKQDEMNEQTKKVATRLEEAIDLFSKNMSSSKAGKFSTVFKRKIPHSNRRCSILQSKAKTFTRDLRKR